MHVQPAFFASHIHTLRSSQHARTRLFQVDVVEDACLNLLKERRQRLALVTEEDKFVDATQAGNAQLFLLAAARSARRGTG